MEMINIGYSCFVSSSRIIALVSPDSSPVKRLVQEAKDKGTLIDATYGKKTKTVIVMDSDHVILSARTVDYILSKGEGKEDENE